MPESGVQVPTPAPKFGGETMDNPKAKGQLSEARVLYEFQKYGIPVSIPWGDNERYDMIAEFDNKLNRIQIKTSNEEKYGAIICYCRSSMNHTTNKEKRTYKDDVDFIIFVNQTKDILAIVPIEEIGDNQTINLRISPAGNGQIKGIRFFSDYSFEKKFS